MANVILTVQFDKPKTWNKDYLDYIKDKQKSLIEVSGIEPRLINSVEKNYLNYIGNEEKNQSNKFYDYENKEIYSETFDEKNFNMSRKDILKKQYEFNKSSEEGSILWKGVISFKNEFLSENKILQTNESGIQIIDDMKLKNYARESINTYIRNSKLDSNNVNYMAGIHYNTDNIHIHFAIVEKEARVKIGKEKQEVFEKCKSSIVNNISRDNNYYIYMDSLKNKIKIGCKNIDMKTQYQNQLKDIANLLPSKGKITYNSKYNSPELICHVDKLMENILSNNINYITYNNELDKKVETLRSNYGSSGDNKLDNFKINKIHELKTSVGTIILEEAKQLNSEVNFEKEKINLISDIKNDNMEQIQKEIYEENKNETNNIDYNVMKKNNFRKIPKVDNEQIQKEIYEENKTTDKYNKNLIKKQDNIIDNISRNIDYQISCASNDLKKITRHIQKQKYNELNGYQTL